MAQLDDAMIGQTREHLHAGRIVQAHAPGPDLAGRSGLVEERPQATFDLILRPRIVQEQDVDVIRRQLSQARVETGARLRYVVYARVDEQLSLTANCRAGRR